MSYRITTALVAVFAVATILWLIRKDHLHPRKAISWILVCLAIGVLGFFPSIADRIAVQLGIAYSPTLILTLGIVVLLIKLLRLDIARTREHQMLVILAQRLSILEKRLDGEPKPGSANREDSDDAGSP